jgi:predicted TIM-barrel fold metal-dependent hydrolase
MTDYEEWLAGDPAWFAWRRSDEHPDQSRVEWKAQVIRENGGRVHLFAPFCPLRAAGDGIDAEVGKTLDLVEKEGFIGVKLYPLMGYYPCGNDYKSKPRWLPRKRRKAGVTWADVDDALDHLYAACADRQIPITAHCSPQGARGPNGASPSDKSQDNQSHPCNWVPVLRKYPTLRLNLAHMAGDHFQTLDDDQKGTITDWAFQIAGLMGDPECPNLYADRSCQLPPSKKKEQQLYAARLFEVLDLNDQVPRRMMNGTDWHLALMYGSKKGEWKKANKRFRKVLAERPAFAERFFGENAADFLGLRPGGRTRERLRTFYTDGLHLTEDQFPAWWAKTAGTGNA